MLSGTLAIETALILAGIQKNEYVAIPNIGTYKISLVLKRLGIIPLFINPGKNLVLEAHRIKKVHKKFNIKAVLAVHYLGIPMNVKKLRQQLGKKIIIIEDIAQGWGIEYSNEIPGKYCDYLTTSFGPTKPLSLGRGGALLYNGTVSQESRLSTQPIDALNSKSTPLPYVVNKGILGSLEKAIMKADFALKKRNKIAELFRNLVSDNSFIFCVSLSEDEKGSWTRFPLFFSNQTSKLKFIALAKIYNLEYQEPLPQPSNAKFLNKYLCIDGPMNDLYILLYLKEENAEILKKIMNVYQ